MSAGSLMSSSQAAASSGKYRVVFFFFFFCMLLFVSCSIYFLVLLWKSLLCYGHDPMVTLTLYSHSHLSFFFFFYASLYLFPYLFYYTAHLRIEILSCGISPIQKWIQACLNRDAFFSFSIFFFTTTDNGVGFLFEMGMTNEGRCPD